MTGVLALAGLAGLVSRYHLGHDYVKGLLPMFDLDREHNVPTWFSTVLLFGAAVLLALVALRRRAVRDRHARRWTILAVGFALMSMDEAAAMHELLIEPVRQALGLGGVLYFAWIVPAVALVAVVGVYLLPLVAELAPRWRRLFIAAAALYLGGAVGLEMVGGVWAEAHGYDNFTFGLLALVEETLEMSGASLFVYALLAYAAAEWGELRMPIGTDVERSRQPSG